MEATSAQRKLGWAIDHLRPLLAEVDAYTKGRQAYTFHALPERLSEQRIEYRCFATEQAPPDPAWALRAGDVIQNLRAALDHLVWAATPEAKQTTSTAFPIFTDPARFRASGTPQYADVDSKMAETIERMQPFDATPTAPDLDLLAILHRLSILDKHRTLATVVGGIEFEGVGLDHPATVEGWAEYASGKNLGPGETYVSTFTVATTAPRLDEGEAEVQFLYHVLIENERVEVLRGIAHRVYEVVVECETGSPPSPFGYPAI
jgi:hypothetical protein